MISIIFGPRMLKFSLTDIMTSRLFTHTKKATQYISSDLYLLHNLIIIFF